MPPKRRGAPAASATPKKPRQSKLAKENDITADEENEIKEVFHLFSTTSAEFATEKEGVIPREDVRKALLYKYYTPQANNCPTPQTSAHSLTNTKFRALGLPPSDSSELRSILSAVDPTDAGFVPYAPFLSLAAAKLRSRSDDAMSAEVDAAFHLFTKGTDGPITLGHLRRIARELKEDNLGDDLLRDMILEANGGGNVNDGVSLEQFHDVMARAGVF